jgi:hypothetical protein
MSVTGGESATTVPPAAMMARLNADLAVVAPEAFKPVGPFEPKPGKPDQLVALLPEPAQAEPLPFSSTQAIPPPRAHACEIQS